MSSENDNTVVNIPENTDKRTNAFKRRKLSRSKANDAMITLIKEAKAACIKASYVLFDSWFSSPDSISISFDAMTAHTAVVFTRYMMLAVSKRESEDPRSMGELFMCCTDELADVSFAQAFSLFMELFVNQAKEFLTISEQQISDFVDKLLESIPDVLKIKLKAA